MTLVYTPDGKAENQFALRDQDRAYLDEILGLKAPEAPEAPKVTRPTVTELFSGASRRLQTFKDGLRSDRYAIERFDYNRPAFAAGYGYGYGYGGAYDLGFGANGGYHEPPPPRWIVAAMTTVRRLRWWLRRRIWQRLLLRVPLRVPPTPSGEQPEPLKAEPELAVASKEELATSAGLLLKVSKT